MVRETKWYTLVLVAAGLAVYAALGWWWAGNGTIEEWLYRVGLTAAAILPVIFTAIYSAKAKWWKNVIGTSLVLAALSLIPTTAPLAYAFWFTGGVLRASWLAWLAVSGPCLSALAFTGMCLVWVRASRDRRAGQKE